VEKLTESRGNFVAGRADRSLLRLRHGFGMIEKENGDLLVRLGAHVDSPMDSAVRFVPIGLACHDFDTFGFAAISEFDQEKVATHDNADPIVWIAMPPRSLTWFQP